MKEFQNPNWKPEYASEFELAKAKHTVDVEHQTMVKALVKDPNEILKSLTPEKVDLLHAALGIATEAGELLDAVKAHVIYGKPLDLENVTEEGGDSEFYWEALRKNVKLTRVDMLQHNLNKLAKRYENYRYSDKAAIDRNDKRCAGDGQK